VPLLGVQPIVLQVLRLSLCSLFRLFGRHSFGA
jgi:hypothetical protein